MIPLSKKISFNNLYLQINTIYSLICIINRSALFLNIY